MQIRIFFFVLGLAFFSESYGQGLIPQPSKVEHRSGHFTVNRSTSVCSPDFPDLTGYLNDHVERACGYRLTVTESPRPSHRILIEKQTEGIPSEGYTLDVSEDGIEVHASDRSGAFYALQTLFQLMPPEIYGGSSSKRHAVAVSCLRVEDAPRFSYRGVMLDVSRTFSDKQTVLRYIDWMSRHKLNCLHWHLTDDNGWRIEIKKYPELTERGAWRGPGEILPAQYGSGNKRYGGYYTQDDIREIVRYAADRAVEIIPEIDLPGHSQVLTSVIPSSLCRVSKPDAFAEGDPHNVLCVSYEANYEMLKDIFTEIAGLFPSQYIHIGCDEVSTKYWQQCVRCQSLMQSKQMKKSSQLQDYFVGRIEKIIQDLGKRCAMWNEAMSAPLDSSALLYGWENMSVCRQIAGQGRSLVMMPCNYCYIDQKQHLWDRGHSWVGRVNTRRLYEFEPEDYLSSSVMNRVRGVEAAQWTELLDRPERFIEYQGYPRLCALSEVCWTEARQRNWTNFFGRLTGSHYARLAAMGIRFRVFPPEVTCQEGKITARSVTSSEEIRYTTDLSEPNASSARYSGPISTTTPENYRFRSFGFGSYSTVMIPTVKFPEVVLQPGQQQTLRLPAGGWADREGSWLLSVHRAQDSTVFSRIEIAGRNFSRVFVKSNQRINFLKEIRLRVDSLALGSDLAITLKNNGSRMDTVDLRLRRSPYMEPKVRVSSSMPCNSRFPITNSSSYIFSNYVRTSETCKAGDYILFTFASPVHCGSVEVRTGLPDVTRYYVTDGVVSYSTDGIRFEGTVPLDLSGYAVLYPPGPIRAVRIDIRSTNGEPIVSWQSLRIMPRPNR